VWAAVVLYECLCVCLLILHAIDVVSCHAERLIRLASNCCVCHRTVAQNCCLL
jgi:hypothetical protein